MELVSLFIVATHDIAVHWKPDGQDALALTWIQWTLNSTLHICIKYAGKEENNIRTCMHGKSEARWFILKINPSGLD